MYTLKERVGDDIIMKQKLISDALSPPAPPPHIAHFTPFIHLHKLKWL